MKIIGAHKTNTKNPFFIICGFLLGIIIGGCSVSSNRVLDDLSETSDPFYIGEKITERYISESFNTSEDIDKLSGKITFKEVYTWLGAIEFARRSNDEELLQALQQRFYPLLGSQRQLMPNSDYMEENGFGALPLQLFLNSENDCFFYLGIDYANRQWELPKGVELSGKEVDCADQGLSWQSRFTTEDMFVVSVLQSRAFLASGDEKYLNRAAYQMAAYIDSLQQPDGLFFHSRSNPYYLCRANGWVASAMTELLKVLPDNNIHYPQIMASYLKMINVLERRRNEEGLWNQFIGQKNSWTETSGSAMFISSIATGLTYGWLDKDTFQPLVRKGWISLVSYLNQNGEIRNVGQELKGSKEYYSNKPITTTDNLYGKASILWCAAALVDY